MNLKKIKSFSTISALSLLILVLNANPVFSFFNFNKPKSKDAITATLELPDEFYQENYIPEIFMEFSKPVVSVEKTEINFSDGIRIEPKIGGTFTFVNPSYFKFTPTEQWKSDREYKIIFNKKIEKFKNLNKLEYSFKTPVNKPYISFYELYENPLNIKEKNISAGLIFPYPVELKEVEKNISFTTNNGKLSFSLTTNDDRTQVYVLTELITIGEKEDYVVISYNLKKGEIKDRLRIPSSNDYFKFDSVKTTTVFNNEKQEEEQFVVLNFSRPVAINDVLNKLNLNISDVKGGCYRSNIEKLKPSAEKLDFENRFSSKKYSKTIGLKINEPNKLNACILTSLNGQLVSEDGFILNDSEVRTNGVPSFTKEVRVIFDGVIINSNGDKNLTFMSRGYDGLKVEINRLNDNSINHLITQTSGDFKSAYFNDYNFNENNISEKFEETIVLNNVNPAKSTYSSISLKKYLKGKRGFFIVKVNGYDPINKRNMGGADRRMVIVTDTGIMVKNNRNSTKDVFVSSLESGKPLVGAKIDVVGKNGLPIETKYTDMDGHALFPSMDSYKNEKQPVVYIVYNSGDVSFIPFNRYDRDLNFSRFNVGGIYNSYNSESIKSYIFTDRDLYRPGEIVEMAFILKDENLKNLPSDMPLEVIIRDPSWNEVYSKKIKNEGGFFDLKFETKPSIQTGNYDINLYLINEKGNRGRNLPSKTITIEEFQPDRMKVSINFDNVNRDGWYRADKLTGQIKLENLFGAPAQNRTIKTKVNVRPTTFYFQKYRDYRFTDVWNNNSFRSQEMNENLPNQETNIEGIVKFNVDLSKYINGTYSLSFITEGFEPDGGRSVIANKNLLISPLEFMVGYKTDSNLKYIKKDSEHTIEFIAIDSKLNKIDVNNLKIKLQKITEESVLTQDSSGKLVYQNEKVFTDISNENFSISNNNTIYKLPTKIVGDIQLTIVDQKENILSVVNYSVAGSSNNTFSIDKNSELKLTLDREEYNSGDIIEMSITSPYTGYGLITIEREKVYAYKWFKSENTNFVQSINVPSNIDGNAYVNVSFMRDINSEEIFVSPLSYAVTPFNINKSKFEVKVNLDSPTKVKPGETLKINYSLNKNANVLIYGVDEGILQVAKYNLPNPLAEFTKKIALEVKTSQIYDLVLPTFEIVKMVAGIGGDVYYDQEMLKNNLNPFARKVNAPVAFWSGILKNKTSGVYEYKVPDYFNGKIRIMAVAVGNGVFGSSQTFTDSQADIVLLPNVPVNISPDDEIEVSVGVGNYIENSGNDAKISIMLETSDNLSVINGKAEIEVSENYEKTAKFTVKAMNNKLGNGEIKFIAKCESCPGKNTNSLTSTVSVRPSAPYKTLLTSGLDRGKKFENLQNLYGEYANKKLAVSGSPIVLIQGLFDFLSEFPHGCSEQITSKVFPIMLVKSKFIGLVDSKKFDELMKNTISELASRQNNDGGFGAWSDMSYTNSFHSVYIMHFLTLAQKNNYYVPKSTFNRGIEWLKTYASANPSDINDFRNKAYGIYVLTLNDILQTANIVSLEKIMADKYNNSLESDIGALYIASSYKLMQQDKKADDMAKKFKLQKTWKYYNSFDSSDLRNVQYMYLTALHFPNIFEKIKVESGNTLLDMVQGNRYNTLVSSYAIMALANFTENNNEKVSFEIKDRSGKTIQANIENTPFNALNILASDISEVSFKGDGQLYYTLIQQGFSKENKQIAFSKNIETTKKILNSEGKEVNNANIGDELIIHIKIQNLRNSYIENLAIIDLLPAGFEIKEVLEDKNMFSKNLREDRFLGYAWLGGNSFIEIKYVVKATTRGILTVPAVFVQDLYNTENQAQSNSGEITIK